MIFLISNIVQASFPVTETEQTQVIEHIESPIIIASENPLQTLQFWLTLLSIPISYLLIYVGAIYTYSSSTMLLGEIIILIGGLLGLTGLFLSFKTYRETDYKWINIVEILLGLPLLIWGSLFLFWFFTLN